MEEDVKDVARQEPSGRTLETGAGQLEASHTPGPWRIAGKGTIRAGKHDWIANVHWRNRAANARLIAAAPDLLEALRNAAEQFRFYAREHRSKAVAFLSRGEVGEANKSDLKANTNRDFAEKCEAIIAKASAPASPSPPATEGSHSQ